MSSDKANLSKENTSSKTAACPKCGGDNAIKSGLVQGEQRWKCKGCSYQYTRVNKRGRPIWQKSLSVFLYSSGVPMSTIAEIFDVSPSTILKWVRKFSQDHVQIPTDNIARILELKEIQSHIEQSCEKGSPALCISIYDEIFKNSKGILVSKRLS
ncbi:MAG: hypothetical protein COV35_05855 [Alphaproteobacteria bacterium CG11_big_fil_rev_8_21_14_0_20_39_49]|nr:MAG: hypothetical protein COV35_05855 [Alphaproteobacteria bacterium CG11_big_fil_rev_8_21_14_0_20_39_49]